MNKLLTLSTIAGFLLLITSITSIAYENNNKDEKINIARSKSALTPDEIVKLKERHIPSFKVSKILKEEVNKSLLRGF